MNRNERDYLLGFSGEFPRTPILEAVRLTHLPTGIQIEQDVGHSIYARRDIALMRLEKALGYKVQDRVKDLKLELVSRWADDG